MYASTLDRLETLSAPPEVPRPAGDDSTPAEAAPLMVGDTVRVPLLFEAIPGDKIQPNTPYLIVNSNGKGFALGGDAGADWNWATWARYPDKLPEIFPVWFGRDPIKQDAHFYMRVNGTDKKLYLDGDENASWNWVAWQKSSTKVEFLGQLVAVSGTTDRFTVSTNKEKSLCFDGNAGDDWNWAFIGGDSYVDNRVEIRVGAFRLTQANVRKLVKAEWPAANLERIALRATDKTMELVDTAKVQSIFQASGLKDYTQKPEIFDSDDFAFVFKSEVSKAQYKDNPGVPYAIGVINGMAGGIGRAAIVFVSIDGVPYVVDPQNGNVVRGNDWKATNGQAYVPDMIVF